MRDVVGNRYELACVGVDEGLHPSAHFSVPNLECVSKGNKSVILHEVFQLWCRKAVLIVAPIQLFLGRRDGFCHRDSRLRRGKYGHADEGAPERDELVSLVESDVGDSVCEGNAVGHLFEEDVTDSDVAVERRLEMQIICSHGVAKLNKGCSRVLDRCLSTSEQGVIDTIAERLHNEVSMTSAERSSSHITS